MKRLLITTLTLASLTGCGLFHSAVPTTEIKGSIGGQSFRLSNPKNTTITNLTVEVSTNGTAKLSLGYMDSHNDSNVVAGAYAGQAALATAVGDATAKAFQAGASAAGAALGAAAKAP